MSLEDRIFFQGESGLTGLALHPQFPQVPWVYIMYTYLSTDGPFNRISRFTEVDGRATQETILYDGLADYGGCHQLTRLR